MAKVDLNAITEHFRGKVGDLVFKKVRGRLQAALRPKRRIAPPTEDQLAQRVVFKKALAYARRALANPESQPVYQRVAGLRKLSPFATAVGDYFNPPEVQDINVSQYQGRSGDKIAITAADDVAVKSVGVVVRKSDGTAIEQGPAALLFEEWVYTATTAIPSGQHLIIEVTATDWVGNKGVQNKMYP